MTNNLKSYIDNYGDLVDDKSIILKYITDNNLDNYISDFTNYVILYLVFL